MEKKSSGALRIEPTVGRVLWFWPALPLEGASSPEQPCAAMVARVNENGTVNLGYLDHDGNHRAACDVPLLYPEPGDEREHVLIHDVEHLAPWCQWMPYQIGQAARTEQERKPPQEPAAGVA